MVKFDKWAWKDKIQLRAAARSATAGGIARMAIWNLKRAARSMSVYTRLPQQQTCFAGCAAPVTACAPLTGKDRDKRKLIPAQEH
jgi:hypothetical protein